jgi:hypothetical protein
MIAILSWGAHETLVNTLESYRQSLDLVDDERVIFFQEITDKDKGIAREYGYEYIGSRTNVGIAAAYKELLACTGGDLFLFLENDWEMIEDNNRIYHAADLLRQGTLDLVRLRHRRNPGNPLWTRQFEGREYERPTHLLDAVHWTDNPEKFPEIGKIDNSPVMYVTTARYANWTNNPHLAKTDFLRTHIAPRLNGDIESGLQPWWEQQDFRVGQGDGVFTHNRLDR